MDHEAAFTSRGSAQVLFGIAKCLLAVGIATGCGSTALDKGTGEGTDDGTADGTENGTNTPNAAASAEGEAEGPAPEARIAASSASAPHVVLAAPEDAREGATFYVTFFSYQKGIDLLPAYSHTFALFTRTEPDGAGGARPAESFTVSWMPADGTVNVLLGAEPGDNTSLNFEMARGASYWRMRAFAWGPFRVPEVVWTRAVRQRRLLDTGRVWYRASTRDPISRNYNYLTTDDVITGRAPAPSYLNCIHAVGDVAPRGGTVTGTASGFQATAMVVDHFEPWFIDGAARASFHDRHVWLSRALNLSRFNGYFPNGVELYEEPGRN